MIVNIEKMVSERLESIAAPLIREGEDWEGRKDRCRNNALWVAGMLSKHPNGKVSKAAADFIKAWDKARHEEKEHAA